MLAELHNFVLIGAIAMAFGYITGNTRQLNALKLGILAVVIWLFVSQFNHSKAHFLVMLGLFLMGFLLPHAHLMEGFGRSLSNAINAIRYRSAYDELKRKEEELEAMRQQFASAQAQQRQQEAQAQWQKRRQQAAGDNYQGQADGKSADSNQDNQQSGGTSSSRRSGSGRGRRGQGRASGENTSSRRSSTSGSKQQGGNSRRSTTGSSSSTNRKRTHHQKASSANTGSSSRSQESQSSTGSSKQAPPHSNMPPPLKALRDIHLKELELVPGQSYTKAELKQAFKRNANKYHPDKHQGKPQAFIDKMEAKFIAMKAAHDWLEKNTSN